MEGKMMDAISRSELITFVKEKYHDIVAGGYPYNIVAWDLVRIIENFLALDVAPVVRCKECEWNDVCKSEGYYLGANGFCSKSKKKDGEAV